MVGSIKRNSTWPFPDFGDASQSQTNKIDN